VGYYVRYFADAIVTLKAIGGGLVGVDPTFKIDGGDLLRGGELLGELEINVSGTDMFDEDLRTWLGQVERARSPAGPSVMERLQRAKSIVTLHVIDGARAPNVTWEMLGPLWSVLPALSTGLTQMDGQGVYDGSQLVVPTA
jgi:hypothetical protein